ncbi:sulfurtransferase [Pseudodesulfovibrio cashew]|uniref:Sulfurtransferase n=1 Tax=Pseudodesulfovibrio cashew TaxID=2678688 RepID=A0A6I6JHW7_9BACT|nr:rhodanese-like domain-containing protein [Pseudodesulfovibrio cashew]QGY40598.1 sulfurtransferase [Pseudodesulfovibrio cashew]
MTQPVQMMESGEAREYMNRHKPEEYFLLDVRQDWEYEEFHIPGARLIPLAELPDRLDEVDRSKPVLVYCLSGGRSSAAAGLLNGQGFDPVYNLVGGAMAWQGHTAFGPIELGMAVITGDEAPVEVIIKAYAMESSLQEFYLHRADVAETLERIELFQKLAGFEDRHKDVLYNHYTRIVGDKVPRGMVEDVALGKAGNEVEGGVDLEAFLEEYAPAFEGDKGVLEMAAMIEAQALDYYLRCAARAENPETRDILQQLAREEKAHLRLVGKYFDDMGAVSD